MFSRPTLEKKENSNLTMTHTTYIGCQFPFPYHHGNFFVNQSNMIKIWILGVQGENKLLSTLNFYVCLCLQWLLVFFYIDSLRQWTCEHFTDTFLYMWSLPELHSMNETSSLLRIRMFCHSSGIFSHLD